MKSESARQSIAILVLAAGSSSRMGRSKQLLPINGKPLLLLSIEAALEVKAGQVIVVLGANREEHRKIIRHLPVDVVINEEWERGMGNSLKKGMQHVMASAPSTEAVIVMVCDQPMITGAHLDNLIRAFTTTKCPIVASAYGGAIGVPALFDQTLFNQLLHLRDQAGAKQIIESNAHGVINFPGGEVDLDTPGDYKDFTTTRP